VSLPDLLRLLRLVKLKVVPQTAQVSEAAEWALEVIQHEGNELLMDPATYRVYRQYSEPGQPMRPVGRYVAGSVERPLLGKDFFVELARASICGPARPAGADAPPRCDAPNALWAACRVGGHAPRRPRRLPHRLLARPPGPQDKYLKDTKQTLRSTFNYLDQDQSGELDPKEQAPRPPPSPALLAQPDSRSSTGHRGAGSAISATAPQLCPSAGDLTAQPNRGLVSASSGPHRA